MAADRWQRVQQLFAAAIGLEPADRDAYLQHACADDPALLIEVQALLARDATADRTLGRIVSDAAEEVLSARGTGAHGTWIGRRLGPWRIESHLADGGMGAVYLARRADGQYEQSAAVKLLNPARVSAAAKARLELERQILARLVHPNIARLLDGGTTDDGVPYLVMEYIDGRPIDVHCNAEGLTTAARLQLFLQVCDAVEFAHRNLVVHRDLKPSNILVDARGMPKLLDFGISKLIETEGATLTAADERVLTPAHASPEQIRGDAITTATDVYGLGVLLYDVLAGRLPFLANGRTSADVAREILESDPARPSTAATIGSNARIEAARRRGEQLTPQRLRRELEGDLDNIVLMALRKEVERRYPSVRALADDIGNVLAHRPVVARAPSLAYRSAKFVRRHRAGVLATLAVAACTAALLSYYTYRLADERDRALAAEQRSRATADFLARLLQNTSADAGASRQTSVQHLLDSAAARVRDELHDQPELGAVLRLALGHAYHSWGEYESAERVLKEALAIERRQGTTPDADVASVIQMLGIVAHDRGDLPASLDWAQQEVAVWRALGNDAELGVARTGVAIALSALGRGAEAEAEYGAALQALHRAHGDEDAEIAWTLNNLAWLLHSQGRYREAQPYYERALAMQRKLKVPPIDMAQTMKNLGGLFYNLGDYARATPLWNEALKINESVYGDGGHVALANMEGLFSMLLRDQGRLAEAEAHALKAIRINTALVGENHRRTASDWSNYASVLLAEDRLDDAEHAIRHALAAREKTLPPGHPETAASHAQLGDVLLRRGRFVQAARELARARAVYERPGTSGSPRLDDVLRLLGLALAGQGRVDEGAALLRRAIEGMQGRLPPGHWKLRVARALLLTPPFVLPSDTAAIASARQTLAELQQEFGPAAPGARAIERRLPPLAAERNG